MNYMFIIYLHFNHFFFRASRLIKDDLNKFGKIK